MNLTKPPANEIRIGVIDTGVNPWHSHVRGNVSGCRIFAGEDGLIQEDDDFRDPVGHGTAVAGILREELPEAELYAVRVFDEGLLTYPSLVARGILRAAAEGCQVINMSLALPPQEGADLLTEACACALKAGCLLVAAGHPDRPGLLPASLPYVYGVVVDDRLHDGEVILEGDGPYQCRARGMPRGLGNVAPEQNLWGHSFACARAATFIAQRVPMIMGTHP